MPALALLLTPLVSLNLLGVNVGNAVGTTIGGVSLGTIVTLLMATLVRDNGKAFARRYFKGYATTITCLRLRENSGYAVKERRTKLEAVVGVQLLTKQQEKARPVEADERLRHAVNTARNMMRDQKHFQLLWRELKSYGYWRNIYALKWWGIGLALLSALVPIAIMVISPHGHHPVRMVAILAGIMGLLFWTLGVRKTKFVAASDRYTNEFFNGLFQL